MKKPKKKQTKTKQRGRHGDIKLLILDVDGVLTSGSIIYDLNGTEYKIFNVQDGYGIVSARKAGINIAIVSGRSSEIVDKRAAELGIEDVYQGVSDKAKVLRELLVKYRLSLDQVCAVGDDIPDVELMRKTGFPVAVSNARPEVKKIARYITRAKGGAGAVREITDLIIR